MNTAQRVTTWTRSWTNDDGVTKDYELPVDVSGFGNASLWRFDPPLNGEQYALICDRGSLLQVTGILGEPEGLDVTTKIPTIVEVFAANADGSVKSMTTISEPISLRRPADGIDMEAILRVLGYVESTA